MPLDQEESHQEENGNQWSYTGAKRASEYDDDDKKRLAHEQKNLPIVAIITVARGQEAKSHSEPPKQVFVLLPTGFRFDFIQACDIIDKLPVREDRDTYNPEEKTW